MLRSFALPLVLASLVLPLSAHAGEYVVGGCHGPSAPDAAWSSQTSGAGTTDARCAPAGDVLDAAVAGAWDPENPRSATARWRLAPPADTTLVGLDLSRRATAVPGVPPPEEAGWSPSRFSYTLNAGGVADRCVDDGCDGLSHDVTWRDEPPGVGGASVGVACGPCAIGGGIGAEVVVGAVHLWDDRAPLVGAPSGPLFDPAGVPGGVRTLEVSAVDAGGGLYDALLEVDGVVRAAWPFTPGDAACAKPFAALVPCPLAGTGRWAFDTSGLAVGDHPARLLVRDAGGATGASPTATIRVTAPAAPAGDPPGTEPPPAGPGGGGPTGPVTAPALVGGTTTAPAVPVPGVAAGASASAGAGAASTPPPGKIIMSVAGRAATTVGFGARPLVAGRLVDARGAAVAGATIALATRPLGRGVTGAWAPAGTATTGADGRFGFRPARGGSREVRATGAGGTSAVVRVLVRAGVAFVAPARARRGVTIALRGTVAQTAGKLVELQARDGKVWRTFATARTDDRGRFRRAFRFHRPGPPARYELRARIPAEAGFAFRPATSAGRWISVR